MPKHERSGAASAAAHGNPAAEQVLDGIILAIRKFIAAAIFFNAQAAEQAGLSLTDMQMIHTLKLYGPATPSRLAAWTGLSSGGVTVALDRLQRAGYLRREPNPADRRSLLVTPVLARLRRISRLYEGVEGATRGVLAPLPESDLEAVLRFFTALETVRTGSESLKRPG